MTRIGRVKFKMERYCPLTHSINPTVSEGGTRWAAIFEFECVDQFRNLAHYRRVA